MARERITIDPAQIANASQIPPPGAQPVGLSAQGFVEVSCGTLPGDVDAQPAAKELLGAAPDTGDLSNADYVYSQVSALYGGIQLPGFKSPSANDVKSLVFVSGSAGGGYGAFHIGNAQTQTDFDRIVVDSLNASGNYSAGSGLGSALKPIAIKVPRLFAASRGPGDLLGIVHAEDQRIKAATVADLEAAHEFAQQSRLALQTALEARNPSAKPKVVSLREMHGRTKEETTRRLIHANQEILGLVRAVARASAGRQYLSTALFTAEIIESFQALTRRSDAGRTDGESFSRVLSFKLTPEIALVPGFSGGVAQQWWRDNHPDWVNDNTQNDQSTDGNGAGVMFLLFLTDFLGIPLDEIVRHVPAQDGSPLGQTYADLVKDHPELSGAAGANGESAFMKMVSLLQEYAQTPEGLLNLPADGNPFPGMQGAKQGGLFARNTPGKDPLPQDVQAALGLEVQIEQQLASLKTALQRIQGDLPASLARRDLRAYEGPRSILALRAAFKYGPPLPASVVAALEQRVAPYRAPQYDESLQKTFWPHVYNELPGSGTNTNRLQVITGSIQAPEAVQVAGTISETKHEADGDLHIAFQPDDPAFPTNQSGAEPPLEIEIIYAGPVTQADAKQAQQGYTNPFDVSQLRAGTRIQAAGPLIFDRAHGRVDAAGNVQYGLEVHPLAGMTILGPPGPVPPSPVPPGPEPPQPAGQLAADLASALGQAATLSQSLGSLASLIQKMQGEGFKS